MEEKFFQTAPVSSWSSTTAMRIPATHRGRGEWENGREEIRDEKLFGHKRLKRKKNSQPVHWPTVDSEPDDDSNNIDAADLYISGGYDTEFDK